VRRTLSPRIAEPAPRPASGVWDCWDVTSVPTSDRVLFPPTRNYPAYPLSCIVRPPLWGGLARSEPRGLIGSVGWPRALIRSGPATGCCVCTCASDPEPADCRTGTTASEWGVERAGLCRWFRPPTASCSAYQEPSTRRAVRCSRHPLGWRSRPPQAPWSGPGSTARPVPKRSGTRERRSLFTDHPSSRTVPEPSASPSGKW